MRIILSLFILLASANSFADHIPIGHKKWRMDDGRTKTHIGGMEYNYQKPDKSFAAIDNTLIPEGDSVFETTTAILKTRINKQGVSTVTFESGGETFIVTQELIGIGWLNTQTRARQWIDQTPNWNNFSHDDSIASWGNVFPATDYLLRKSNGQLEHNIRYKPPFVDSLIVLYNQRSDSSFLGLANVMKYTLSDNILNFDSAIGDVNRRTFKDSKTDSLLGVVFELQRQFMYWDLGTPAKNETGIEVRQYWVFQNSNLYCVEYIMMSDVKKVYQEAPGRTIWHNTSTQIDDPDVEDGGGREDAVTVSFGGSTTIQLYGGTGSGNRWWMVVRCTDLDNELPVGEDIDDVEFHTWTTSAVSNDAITWYHLTKNAWIEGAATGAITAGVEEGMNLDYWDNNASFDITRGSGGGSGWFCEQGSGTENTTDGGSCTAANADLNSTGVATATMTGTGDTEFDVTAFAQAQNDDEFNIIGWGDVTNPLDHVVGATENTTASLRPYFVFTTSAPAAGGPIIMELGKMGDEPDDDEWLPIEVREEIKNKKRELTQ